MTQYGIRGREDKPIIWDVDLCNNRTHDRPTSVCSCFSLTLTGSCGPINALKTFRFYFLP